MLHLPHSHPPCSGSHPFKHLLMMFVLCSVVSDSVIPWTKASQTPLSMGFPRQEFWSRLPFPSPGDLPDPGIEPASLTSPALRGRFFISCTTWKLPWRSLVGCSPWGREESDTTEQLYFHFSLSCTGEGNGNPLQCSCLENPKDRRAWWAAIYGVTQSRTRLK